MLVRGAIKNERQANGENRPFGTARDVTSTRCTAAIIHIAVRSGPMDDLNRAIFAEMRAFCAPYYVPNNAIMAISGDFDTAKARATGRALLRLDQRAAQLSRIR